MSYLRELNKVFKDIFYLLVYLSLVLIKYKISIIFGLNC